MRTTRSSQMLLIKWYLVDIDLVFSIHLFTTGANEGIRGYRDQRARERKRQICNWIVAIIIIYNPNRQPRSLN